MFGALKSAIKSSRGKSLAETFSKLGWLGFWLQVAIGAIPVSFLLYAWIVDRSASGGTRGGLALIDYLTIASILVLVFTTVWFYRYTRLAKRIADAEKRPPESVVQRTAWKGVAASTLGIVFSMLVMLLEVVQILIYFLRVPQAGVPVIQTTRTAAGESASWVSAADIVSLMSLIITTLVEVAVLALGLWLLFRTMIASLEYPNAGATDEPRSARGL